MTTRFLADFQRDLRKLRDAKGFPRGRNVEAAQTVGEIRGLTRLTTQGTYYRIRIGDWRIGLHIDRDVVTFVRCLHRRELYRFFA